MSAPAPPALAAAAPAPVANSPPRSRPQTPLGRTIEYIITFTFTIGVIAGTYFCAGELSHPWQPSHVSIVVTMIALSSLDLLMLIGSIEWLIELLSGPALSTTNWATGPIYKAYTCLYTVLFAYSLAVASIMATYYTARELRNNFSVGIIIALILLALLDLLLVVLCGSFVLACIDWYRKPVRQARIKWFNARLTLRPRITREQAMAELERDFGNVV